MGSGANLGGNWGGTPLVKQKENKGEQKRTKIGQNLKKRFLAYYDYYDYYVISTITTSDSDKIHIVLVFHLVVHLVIHRDMLPPLSIPCLKWGLLTQCL